jgi:hypothetical protein
MAGKRLSLLLIVSISLVFVSTPLLAQPWPPPCEGYCADENPGDPPNPCAAFTGGENGKELVRAVNAAYARVLNTAYRNAKGEDNYWGIAEEEGIADKYNTTVFDCYPYVTENVFPEPTEGGLLECILDRGAIRFGLFDSDPECVTSSSVGHTAAERTLRAIIDEIGDHYYTGEPDVYNGNTSIEIEERRFDGGPWGMFRPLECDCVDMTSNVHSLGGVTVRRLRKDIGLFTCTIRASQHVFLVRQKDWATGKYRTMNDLVEELVPDPNDPNADQHLESVCGGDLDNHVIRSIFGRPRQFRADCTKEAPVPNPDPNGFHDIGICIDRVKNKESEVMMHWDPTLEVPGLKTVLTPVVGGTPYWIKK